MGRPLSFAVLWNSLPALRGSLQPFTDRPRRSDQWRPVTLPNYSAGFHNYLPTYYAFLGLVLCLERLQCLSLPIPLLHSLLRLQNGAESPDLVGIGFREVLRARLDP